MNFFDYKAIKVWFSEEHICVELADGRKGKLPIHRFKRLAQAKAEDLNKFEIIDGYAIHWPTLDEDLSVEGFFVKSHADVIYQQV